MPPWESGERAFHKTMSKFPTGVAVITALRAGRPIGVTACGFTGVPGEPPMVVVTVTDDTLSLDRNDGFAVCVLAQHQCDIALRFDALRFEAQRSEARRSEAPRFEAQRFEAQRSDSRRLAARRLRRPERAFDGLAWWPARDSGAPVLSGAVAWLECIVDDVLERAGRAVILGRVLDVGHVDGEPLLQVGGGYRGLDRPLPPPLLPALGGLPSLGSLPAAGPASRLSLSRHG